MPDHLVAHQGRLYGLGSRQRPFDPREVAYRLAPPPAVDLSQRRSLARWRTRVEDQGQMGSCVAHAVTSAAEMLAAAQGRDVQQLDRLWLYARTRQREGTFPQDAGSYPADACDIAMTGIPRESVEPLGYIADPTVNPAPNIDADASNQDYVASHRPFYATDPGGFVAGMWNALDQGLPVVMALAWHQDFFSPPNGILPVRSPASGIVGGHAIVAWGYQPAAGGREALVWCRNSWGTGWPGQPVTSVNPEAEAGDFAIPASLFTNGIVWECRAVSPEPFAPPPPPPPPPGRDDYQRCLDVGHTTLTDMNAYAGQAPHSTSRKWWAIGGAYVLFAQEQAKAAGGSALSMLTVERPE